MIPKSIVEQGNSEFLISLEKPMGLANAFPDFGRQKSKGGMYGSQDRVHIHML